MKNLEIVSPDDATECCERCAKHPGSAWMLVSESENARSRPAVSALLFILILFMVLFAVTAHGQETYVSACATKPACTLTQSSGPVSWANGNQVWIVPLQNGTNSVRIWIRNLNTTSAHTGQAVSVFLTDDPNASSLLTQSDRWTPTLITDNNLIGAQCSSVAINNPTAITGTNGKATCYVSGMFGGSIAVRITGAVAAAGSPDTFELGVYQGLGYPSGPQPGGEANGTNLNQLGIQDATPIPYFIPTGSSATASNAPQGPAISQNPALPVQSIFQRAAVSSALSVLNPWVIGCVNGNFGTVGAGRYQFVNCDTNGNINVSTTPVAVQADPCLNSAVAKTSVAINITSATTTQLVAPSGSLAVFVCGFSFTVSEVITTANTLQFIAGTGATCGGSTVTKSGLYGAGGITAAAPIFIQSSGGNGSIFSAAASSGVCVVTAIGASGSFQGILTFVQQ